MRKSGPARKGIFLLFSEPYFLSRLARILLLSAETHVESIDQREYAAASTRVLRSVFIAAINVHIEKMTRRINYFIYINDVHPASNVIPMLSQNELPIYPHSKNFKSILQIIL